MSFKGIQSVIANAKNQQEDWLLPNWLEFGSLGMLTGSPFSGKSCIAAELQAAACKWGSFAGMEVPQCPVLLIDLENKDRIVVRRLERATENDLDSLIGCWSKVEIPEEFLPLDPTRIELMIEHFVDAVGGQKPLVIIDTFRSAFEADEMDVQSCKQLLYPLQRVAQRQDAAILILHHRPKSGAQYSGQTAIPGALDYMWMWDSNPETRQGTLSLVGTRGDLQSPIEFVLNDEGRNVWVSDSDNSNEVERLVRMALKNGTLSQQELVNEVRNMWHGNSPGINKTRRMIDLLVGSILYREHHSGKYTYGLIDTM